MLENYYQSSYDSREVMLTYFFLLLTEIHLAALIFFVIQDGSGLGLQICWVFTAPAEVNAEWNPIWTYWALKDARSAEKSGKNNWFIFNNCHFNTCASAPRAENGHLDTMSAHGSTVKVASRCWQRTKPECTWWKATMETNDSISGAGYSHNA